MQDDVELGVHGIAVQRQRDHVERHRSGRALQAPAFIVALERHDAAADPQAPRHHPVAAETLGQVQVEFDIPKFAPGSAQPVGGETGTEPLPAPGQALDLDLHVARTPFTRVLERRRKRDDDAARHLASAARTTRSCPSRWR